MGPGHRTINVSTQNQTAFGIHLARKISYCFARKTRENRVYQAGEHGGLEEKKAASITFCFTSSSLCLIQREAEEICFLLLYTSSRMKVSSLYASATIPNPLLGNCSLISTHYSACCFPSLTEALSDASHTILTLSSAESQVPFVWRS